MSNYITYLFKWEREMLERKIKLIFIYYWFKRGVLIWKIEIGKWKDFFYENGK